MFQELNGKPQPLQLTFRNPPDNFFFMTWNWPLIRRVSMWVFLSGLVAMVALVVTMITSLPKKCNPSTQWYQGKLFYEIFPASFYSGKHQMEGDFKGISLKADYIMKLGVKSVRLNSIFNTSHYPRDYEDISSLVDIAPVLGNIQDFNIMVKLLKAKNISVILDLPVHPFVKKLTNKKAREHKNSTTVTPAIEFLRTEREQKVDLIEDAILYWIANGVDGFYIKGLENLANDPNLAQSLRRWKRIIERDRIIIVSKTFINSCPDNILDTVLKNVDLVDIKLDLSGGATSVTKQITTIQNSSLFSRPGMPWVHWSVGDVKSPRLADILHYGNATLGATLLQLMLPGTPSIFYGDEIGLHQIIDTELERQDIKHLYQLSMMPWPNYKPRILPWIYGGSSNGRFGQADIITKMVNIRSESPSIYMNSVYKEGLNKATAEVKYAENDLLVIQRWYPRRKAFVVACNMGKKHLTTDLSSLLYSGEVVVGPRVDSSFGTISFKDLSLWPGESVVIVLN